MPACPTKTNCVACGCPLTILKGATGRPEPRHKCSRCGDAEIVAWKPPKPARNPAEPLPPLKLDAFMRNRRKVNA